MPSVTRPGPLPLAAACLLAVIVLGLLVATGTMRPLDVAIIELVRSPALLAPLAFLQPLTALGSTPWVAAVALVVLAAELIARRPWLGLAAAGTIGLASLANTGIKDAVQRARPDLLPPLEIEPGYSFPSGHAALSMTAYGIVILLILHGRWSWPVRAASTIALAAVILLVGVSRVYLGVHYPSDVLGGWLTGAAIVLAFEAVVRSRLSPRISREASTAPGGEGAGADRGGPRSDPPGPG